MGGRCGGTFLSLRVAYISNLSLLQNPIKSEVRYKSPLLGNRVKFGAYSWEGLGDQILSPR